MPPTRATHLRSLAVLAVLITALLVQTSAASAAPPPNDARSAPAPVGALPAAISGTTVESTIDADEPPSACGSVSPKGSVWYALSNANPRDLLVAVDAGGDMDATVEVFQRQRSQVSSVGCQTTNRRGEATVDFTAGEDSTYLIRIAPLPNSVQAGFRLRVVAPDPPATPPGPLLPSGGASGQVDRFGNPDDAWSIKVRKGRTYRINLVTPEQGCARGSLFAPGSGFGDPVKPLRCDAQTLFTPDVSGRYSIRVQAPRASRARLAYKLHAGLAKRDDTAPGIELRNDDRVGGRLRGSGLDSLDLYRFSITRRSDLRVRLQTSHDFDVSLLSDGGNRLDRAADGLERRIGPGRYFIAVRARNGDGGDYTVSRLARTITSSRMLADGARDTTLPEGGSVALQLRVSEQVDGPATFTVERFDPLAGWLFDSHFGPRVRGGLAQVMFRPPTVGRWRVTGSFDGTRIASASEGGTAEFRVTEPPTDG
ncbi:MAG: hypothetical protein ACAH82_01855 [Solirubrobacteraceae bacterium]